MQVTKIIKTTANKRVTLYDRADRILLSVDTSAHFAANHTEKSVAIDYDSEAALPATFAWADNLIYLGVDAVTPTLFTGTFQEFLDALALTYFNESSAGSGGGGGGDASAANQVEQLARQGTTSDSPATNPSGTATQIALEKGIFGNGLKYKSLELVMEEGTSIEYYRAVDFDPNTPPTTTTYIDPNTGLVTTPPTNSAYPVVRTLPPNALQQEARIGDLRGQTNFNFGQNFRYAKIVRAIHADLGIAAQTLTIDVLGTTYDLWDGETYELPLLPYPNFYDLGNLSITKGADVIASITYINA